MPQVFEICRRIRTNLILRGTSGKNSDGEKNSPIEEPVAGHAQMNIPDLIDGFITWQSTIPYRANQETPFVDERIFQNRGVCGQAFPFLPSPPPCSHFFALAPIFARSRSEKCFKPAESPTEMLVTQATVGQISALVAVIR